MKKNDSTTKQAQTMPINGLNLSKGDLLKRYHETRFKHYLYGVVSFAMTAMFYISFTSPEWLSRLSSGSINSAVSAGVWALLGLMFSIVITVLIMHSHTTDKGASRLSAYALIIALGITFNVFTETASTMDRVDERVTAKSENSGIFKALTDKIKHSSGQSNTALTKAKNDYADAISTKNARCKHGSNYSKRLCNKWSMRAEEYKTAIDLHQAGASSELSQTVKEATNASHNEDYAQMIVKITMEQLGVSFLVATAFISLFIIGTFEVLGIMIGGDYRKYRDALPSHGIDLHRGREIKYLKKDLKRQNEADEAINQHKIEQSRRELQRLQDARKTQNKMLKLQSEIKKLTATKQPETSPVYATADEHYLDEIEPDSDTVEPIKALKMGFVNTDKLKAENEAINHPKKDGQGIPKRMGENELISHPKKDGQSILNRMGSENHLSASKQAGDGQPKKRKTTTADTGISGKNGTRYRALKKAISKGNIRLSVASIRKFKYGGKGMGSDTAKKYLEALKKEEFK